MIFTKAEIWQTPSGSWLALNVDKNHLPEARRFIDGMTEGKSYRAEFKENRKRRSLDANAYFWVLCGKLAEKIGVPPAEIYRQLIPEIGGNREIVCVPDKSVEKLKEGWQHNGLGWMVETFPSKIEGCTNAILYYGSSTYDTLQMTQLIGMIVGDCREQGIETMTPAELAVLVEGWDAQTDKGAGDSAGGKGKGLWAR